MDLDLWHQTGRLDLLLLAVTDRTVHQDYAGEDPPVQQLFRHLRFDSPGLKGKIRTVRNFFRGDFDVKVRTTDETLKVNTGYLLEIDYRMIR